MNLSDILSIVALIVIGIIAYTVILKIIDYEPTSKRKRLSKVLNDGDGNSVKLRSKFPALNYLIPSYVMGEAEKYHTTYSKRMYATHFIIGTVIGIIAFFVYLKTFITFIPLSLIGGVIATLIKLHSIKKEYIEQTDFYLSEYMSSFTTAYGTFGNLRGAISSILPNVHESIRVHLEKAYLILSEGKPPNQAFHEMNEAFPQKNVRLFHMQLQAIENSGTSDITKLRVVANKMKRKEVFKRDLLIVNKAQFKIWRTFILLIFSLPFMFIIVSYDNFLAIQNNIVSNLVMLLVAMYSLFIYSRFKKEELHDPTEPSN